MEKNDEYTDCLGFDFEPDAVIVGGGDFPSHRVPLQLLHECDKIVCCDGTANQWPADEKRPWQIVGDGDSLSPEAKEKFADIITLSPDQETNDQTKAVKYIAEKGLRKIAIVGATGRREDHTIGNISLLMEYFHEGITARIYTDHGVFIPCKDNTTFRCPLRTAVSIFSFGTQGMTSEGLAYPLYDLKSWWQGTLNHTCAETFSISCRGEYLVFLNYENKKIRE